MQNSSNVLAWRENARIISIVVLLALSVGYNELMYLGILWGLYLLLFGNIKRIPRDNNKIAYMMRMTLYFLPYAMPALLTRKISISMNRDVFAGIVVAIILYVAWLFWNRKGIMLILSDQMIAYSDKESKFNFFMKIYSIFGAAISEEIFFRLFVLTLSAPFYILTPISIIYFFLSHILLPWGNAFTKRDHINQILIGSINVILFYGCNSVIPGIVLHLLINFIKIIMYVKLIDRHYWRPKKYELLIERQLFDGKEL
ncbi:MAG: CPBP family intramembrane metalloprotease [Lachnospiraceae bacterium]|nr:CPBP family intramembrane metalloprotease [Lachnospiraceae bacterium]